MSDLRIEIPAVREVHQGSGHLVIRREGERIRASWVISPADGQGHLVAMEAPGLLTTQCLPAGVLRYDRLPNRHLCRECVTAYLLPTAVIALMTPAGRRSNPAPSRRVPGNQPVPNPFSAEASCGCLAPMLPRCPTDHPGHLLTQTEAAAADLFGQGGRGCCGQRIPAAGRALSGPSAGFCTACLAQRTTR